MYRRRMARTRPNQIGAVSVPILAVSGDPRSFDAAVPRHAGCQSDVQCKCARRVACIDECPEAESGARGKVGAGQGRRVCVRSGTLLSTSTYLAVRYIKLVGYRQWIQTCLIHNEQSGPRRVMAVYGRGALEIAISLHYSPWPSPATSLQSPLVNWCTSHSNSSKAKNGSRAAGPSPR